VKRDAKRLRDIADVLTWLGREEEAEQLRVIAQRVEDRRCSK
jgi:hypothetical protein